MVTVRRHCLPAKVEEGPARELTLAVMVPCFSPLLLMRRTPAAWKSVFICSGVAVVAKSTS